VSVRTRLFLCFGAVTTVLLLPSILAASRLAQLRHLAVEGRSSQASAVAGLGRMQALLSELDRLERSYVATSDPELGRAALAEVASLRIQYERLSDSSYGGQATILGPMVERVESLASAVEGHVARGRLSEATDSLDSMISVFATAVRELASVADAIDGLARQDFLRAERLSETARAQTLGGLALAMILAAVLTGVTTHALTDPLGRLSRAMARVADGTFEAPEGLPYGRSDELGELSRSFQSMARQLDELDRTKAEFLGMASHELKTPLNLISAYAELIEEGLGPDAADDQRGMVRGVGEQARVMTQLVSRLMDISRLEAGTYQLAPEPVSVEDVVGGVKRMFRRLAEEKGVSLDVRVSPSAPESVVLDLDIVRDEILGNLVVNAVRFTPPGGRIEIGVDGFEGGVTFTVRDTGPGVSDEHRDFIFEKHYAADRTRAMGSGLGLAIAKEMVELHHGLITLERTPEGGGAVFRVALPVAPASKTLEVPAGSLIDARDAAVVG
jgi:signal transduction histidine kinase